MKQHIHTDAAFNPDCIACQAAEVERLRDESAYNFREAEKVPGLLAEVERLRAALEFIVEHPSIAADSARTALVGEPKTLRPNMTVEQI